MRNLGDPLRERFAREDLTVCRCIAIEFTSGERRYITDLTRDVPLYGQVFKPTPAMDVSAVRTSSNLAEQNAEITLAYSSDDPVFDERRIRFGSFNDARVEIYYVDYKSPQTGAALILSGKVTDVEQPSRGYCVLQIASAVTTGLSMLFTEVYSKRCRNVFGDRRCKVDIDALAVPFTVIQNFPNLAQFAINGFADFIPPEDDYEPPRENGEYKQYEKGEFGFTVPNAQILKLKLASSGGGGATGGGGLLGLNYDTIIRAGLKGNDAFPIRMTRERGNLVLFEVSGGKGGNKFPGWFSKTAAVGDAFTILWARPQPGSDGFLITGLPGATYTAKGAQGGQGNNGRTLGANSLPQAMGGNGGNGGLVEYTFNLEDPACPIKAGDRINFSNGSAGDSPKYDFPQPDYNTDPEGYLNYTYPGDTGKQGYFELVWQSNLGEALPEKTYNLGSVLWVTGDNAGQIIQIADNSVGLITLTNNPRMPINPGDTGLLRPGCSNFADMCEDRWNNLINMQAEPVTPSGATTAPSPIADTQTDVSKPKPVENTDNYGFPSPRGAG